MKVILTQELRGRGIEGDVVDVARGFAVNYLFPRKMAIEATRGNLKQLEDRRHNIEKREMARRTDAESIAARLEGDFVVVSAKVGETGRLYGSITAQMIEDAILSQLEVDIDRRKLNVHGHIKTLGEHVVTAQLHKDVSVEITVNVVPEEEVAPGKTAPKQKKPEAVVATEASAESADAVEGIPADTTLASQGEASADSAALKAGSEQSLEEEAAAAVAEVVAEIEQEDHGIETASPEESDEFQGA